MRFHSTHESVQNGEITQLAIIECFVAVAIYIGIGVHFKTFRHLAVAVALAPLTLLRTDASVRWGLKTWGQAMHLVDRLFDRPWWALWAVIPGSFILFFAGAAIRLSATVYWVFRRPLDTLGEMPQNWLRQSFCTDLFYPPEVVPLEAVYSDPTTTLTFKEGIEAVQDADLKKIQDVTGAIALSMVLVILYLLPLFYRVSFKATSVAYSPFVWVAHATLRALEPIKLRLERITKGELEKTRRWVSGLVALALVTKIALVRGWIDVSAAPAWLPRGLLESHAWPWWLVTLSMDALITFCLLWYADAALARLESKGAWREDLITKTVSSVAFLRASLGIITMSHFFYVALTTVAARHVKLPGL
jgi:hypothetical protein